MSHEGWQISLHLSNESIKLYFTPRQGACYLKVQCNATDTRLPSMQRHVFGAGKNTSCLWSHMIFHS